MTEAQLALLEVENLNVSVSGPSGRLTIVDGVSFAVAPGSVTAMVGESGSGKTLTALALIGLLPDGAAIDGGVVRFEGKNLVTLDDRAMCSIRGARIGMVFQEPSTALNPVHAVGSQIIEAIRLHKPVSRREAQTLAEGWFAKVGLPDPPRIMRSFPHELSGGMKQRVLLAIAMVAGPALLIADEPTASLDRTLEAEVIERILAERDARQMAVLLVSHDLARVAEVAESLLVMYAGQVVESGPTSAVLAEPAHPYTQGLLASIPDPASYPAREIGGPARKLPVLPGAPPDFAALPSGCRFAPRCALVQDACGKAVPPLFELGHGRAARCILVRSDRESGT